MATQPKRHRRRAEARDVADRGDNGKRSNDTTNTTLNRVQGCWRSLLVSAAAAWMLRSQSIAPPIASALTHPSRHWTYRVANPSIFRSSPLPRTATTPLQHPSQSSYSHQYSYQRRRDAWMMFSSFSSSDYPPRNSTKVPGGHLVQGTNSTSKQAVAYVLKRNPCDVKRNGKAAETQAEKSDDDDDDDDDEHEEEDLDQSMIDYDIDEFCKIVDEYGCAAYEERQEQQTNAAGITKLIRVEANDEECIANLTSRQQVFDEIQHTEAQQSKSGRADLYRRSWVPHGEDSTQNSYPLRVAQFNLLAEGLSSGVDSKTPFPVPENQRDTKGGYGGFTNIIRPDVALGFSLRRWRLLQVLLGGGIEPNEHDESQSGSPPFDLIGLQEVDRFRGFFAPLLALFGYHGIFLPKTCAPGVKFGWYSDGCALFWKTDDFRLVSERRLRYRIGNQVLLLVTLEHKLSGRNILVAVTHLKAQKNEQNEKIRYHQIEELLEHVRDAATSIAHDEKVNGDAIDSSSVPILLMGDLNADPPDEVAVKENSAVARILDKDNFAPLQSAYEIDPPAPELYTTWKFRGDKSSRRTIDYIFYSGATMECSDHLSVPDAEDLEPAKLPGLRYPSDHLMIAATLRLLPRSNIRKQK